MSDLSPTSSKHTTPAGEQRAVLPIFGAQDAQIIADLEVMAADKDNGFWPCMLAIGSLRIIQGRTQALQEASAKIAKLEATQRTFGVTQHELMGRIEAAEAKHLAPEAESIWRTHSEALEAQRDQALVRALEVADLLRVLWAGSDPGQWKDEFGAAIDAALAKTAKDGAA